MSQGRVVEARTGAGTATSLTAELALVGIAAVWGATFVLVQDAVRLLPVLTFLAYRFTAAAALVGPVFAGELRRLPPDGWRGGAAIGACLTAGYVFQTFGLVRTTASNTGFITGLYVVFTPLLGRLLFRRAVSRRTWIAAAAATIGLALLSGGGGEIHAAGDALVLLCAVAFAMHILVTGREAARHPPGPLVFVQLAVCGVTCLVGAAALGQLRLPSTPAVWGTLALTAVVASALGFFVQTYAQRRTTPARTALILASEPVFAGLFAYLLRGETLSALQWTGAAVILAAILWVELAPRAAAAAPGASAP